MSDRGAARQAAGRSGPARAGVPEANPRRAMTLGRCDPAAFPTRPISPARLLPTPAVPMAVLLPAVRRKPDEALAGEG